MVKGQVQKEHWGLDRLTQKHIWLHLLLPSPLSLGTHKSYFLNNWEWVAGMVSLYTRLHPGPQKQSQYSLSLCLELSQHLCFSVSAHITSEGFL